MASLDTPSGSDPESGDVPATPSSPPPLSIRPSAFPPRATSSGEFRLDAEPVVAVVDPDELRRCIDNSQPILLSVAKARNYILGILQSGGQEILFARPRSRSKEEGGRSICDGELYRVIVDPE